MKGWTGEDSAELYGIGNWGRDFLRVNAAGNLEVASGAKGAPGIDLKALVDDLQRRDIGLPILVRFSDLVRSRVEVINGAFARAIDGSGFHRGAV